MQKEKPLGYDNNAPKGTGYGTRPKDWGAEEDAHYMRLVKDERSNSPFIDATSKGIFWLSVQQKLKDLGYVRSLHALRSRWHYKYSQAPTAKGFGAGTGSGMTGKRDSGRREGLRFETRSKQLDTNISEAREDYGDRGYEGYTRESGTGSLRKSLRRIESSGYTNLDYVDIEDHVDSSAMGDGEDQSHGNYTRDGGTRSLRKRPRPSMKPGYINPENVNIEDDTTAYYPPSKKIRGADGLQQMSEPRYDHVSTSRYLTLMCKINQLFSNDPFPSLIKRHSTTSTHPHQHQNRYHHRLL